MYNLYEEDVAVDGGKKVSLHGDYLCVQYDEHPRHIYKRVVSGTPLHPFTDRVEHDGDVYHLAWIEDDKE